MTSRAGLSNPYWGTGANAADFDNDGFTDILITSIGRDLLYKNNGDGTFTEISAGAGLRKIAWHTGSAFGDYDGDGYLDLYVAGYVSLDALSLSEAPPVCRYRGVPGFCRPIGLNGEPDILYHNNRNGTFTETTGRAGVEDVNRYHGFSVVFDDFNQDGKIDIFVANDSDPNYLYLNQGNGAFREAGLTSGVAYSGDGRSQSNMGVAVGDVDNNGRLGLMTTTFSEDYFPLFRQQQPGFFEDVSNAAVLAMATLPWVGCACGFADFDNDGQKDLWVVNGHVYPNADMLPAPSYFQPIAIFANRGGHFTRIPANLSSPPTQSFRGGAAADFNNDGQIGLIVLPISGAPVLLENRIEAPHNWLGLKLRRSSGNRDAIGSKIWFAACGETQFESLRNGAVTFREMTRARTSAWASAAKHRASPCSGRMEKSRS